MITNIKEDRKNEYKIETTHGFYYLTKEGVSRFESEQEYKNLINTDKTNYNFRYKGCFQLLKENLEQQQKLNTWIKDALEIVNNYRVFGNTVDVTLHEICEKIVKNKEPLVITVSKEDILSEKDNFLLLANDVIKNLLKDDNCEIVSVVYIKQ